MSKTIGFVRSAAKGLQYRVPFAINHDLDNNFEFVDEQLNEELFWKNDRYIANPYTQTHMKPSREKFLRSKRIEKYKYNQFLCYVNENYDLIRESAREISRGPYKLAKIEQANQWLGE
ncbi:hypothetical protein CYY_010491 [Polysphondylium violaceum]|uniref:Uncharacterized protein n=1 Tax=Polysphondylium violaceum TaxID=133409 RepID=A0A8J4PJ63_9MYCE|nr:hypothetical protein CYY_010491 [Polysphondylium violaceum]